MNFDSLVFLIFLGVALVVFYALPGDRSRQWWLIGASTVFYGSWDYRFAWLVLAVAAISYVGGAMVADARPNRRGYLWFFIVLLLLPLAFFKYANFLGDNVFSLVKLFNPSSAWVMLDIVLPIGISFFTFQAISYVIDVYRGVMPPETSFRRYALYLTFFPQLVAGPVVRAVDFIPQLRVTWRPPEPSRIANCLFRFIWGLGKKVLIADRLAITIVDPVFANPADASALTILLAVLAFGLLIYADFSAYSDMALATAGLMGFRLNENFLSPYTSTSVREFWQRWHVSLSTWIRDYIYISLGGSRGHAELRTYVNLFFAMLLCGLWHGAAWTFVIWGGFHGVLLIIERIFVWRNPENVVSHFTGWLWTFVAVNIGWMIFRAESVNDLAMMTERVLGWQQGRFAVEWPFLVFFALCAAIIYFEQVVLRLAPKLSTGRLVSNGLPTGFVLPASSLAAIGMLLVSDPDAGLRPFIYFQF